MGAEGFIGGFNNKGRNFGITFESNWVSFCVGTKVVAGLEEADPPIELLRLGCPFAVGATDNLAATGTGGGGILFWEGLIDSPYDDEDFRKLGESVVHERVED